MNGINVNYNQPVPIEHVKGTTVAGPEIKQPESEKTEPIQQEQKQAKTEKKGTVIDKYA